MSKKKHPEHVNHERWLVSYADFITLLFAFFVVLFASGQSDKRKLSRMAAGMQGAFVHNGIFEAHSPTPPISSEQASLGATPTPLGLPIPATPEGSGSGEAKMELQKLNTVIQRESERRGLPKDLVTLRPVQDGLALSLREAGFFASGSAEVNPAGAELLHSLAASLPHGPMRVEGHTDNRPIHTAQFATNWELSTARAATITRLLLEDGATQPESISAVGYAEFHPMASNSTEAGRTQNRRVDIVLLSPAQATAQTPAQHPAPERAIGASTAAGQSAPEPPHPAA